MKIFTIALIFSLLSIQFGFAQFPPIPRDTTYATHLAFKKMQKYAPDAAIADPELSKDVLFHENLVYCKLDSTPFGPRELHLDIFHPKKKGKYPVLMMIHGGGWRSGNKSMEAPMAKKIAAAGYVCIPVEYRLSLEANYPLAIYEIKAAIRWVRANAEKYNIDTTHIAIEGNSAGGQLAALVGFTSNLPEFEGTYGVTHTSSSIQAVVDIDGVVDFMAPASLNLQRKPNSADVSWLGGTFFEKPAVWKEASPIFWVNEKSAPICFVNSTQHRFHAGCDELLGLMAQNNIYAEEHTIPDSRHTFWLFHPWFDPTVNYIIAFMDKVLKNK